MAKTKKKRNRKHRGTQGGSIATRPAARPRNRQEARQRAQQRKSGVKGGKGSGKAAVKSSGGRKDPQPGSWSGAFQKGALASLLFFALFAFLFKRPIASSAGLALATLVFYVPLSYYLDNFMYRRFEANLVKERERAKQGDNDA